MSMGSALGANARREPLPNWHRADSLKEISSRKWLVGFVSAKFDGKDYAVKGDPDLDAMSLRDPDQSCNAPVTI
jgi:hypothetical protein